MTKTHFRAGTCIAFLVGASLVPRSLDAFAFIGRQLNPPKWIDDTVLRFRASADENKRVAIL